MDGFHINPEAYAIIGYDAVIGSVWGFHVKPEAYAIIGHYENQPVLRVTITFNGVEIIVPFTTTVSTPAVIIQWNGIDWYNPLVAPTSSKASAVRVIYGEQIFALST